MLKNIFKHVFTIVILNILIVVLFFLMVQLLKNYWTILPTFGIASISSIFISSMIYSFKISASLSENYNVNIFNFREQIRSKLISAKNGLIGVGIFLVLWSIPSMLIGFSKNIKEVILTNNNHDVKINIAHHYLEDCTYKRNNLCSNIEINLLSVQSNNSIVDDKINGIILKKICCDNVSEINNYMKQYLIDNNFEFNSLRIDPFANMVNNRILTLILDFNYMAFRDRFSQRRLNFDLKNGNQITLDDLFIENYETKLASLSENLLYQNYGFDGWNFKRGEFKINSNFIINEHGLDFFYNQYEIAAGAFGMFQITIPYIGLSQMIKQDGPLSGFLPLSNN